MTIFGCFSNYRTPTPTTRDTQERVIRLVKEERARCGSAQPHRKHTNEIFEDTSSRASETLARKSSTGLEKQLTEKVTQFNASLGSTTTQVQQRVSTPILKELVCGGNDGALLNDPDAAAKQLNGPVSPSRCRVRRCVAEMAAEVAKSASMVPTPSPPAEFSVPRPASASPALFHTVGPREFARLKVRMRTQSPWALHVEDDMSSYAAVQAAKKAEEQAKQAMWVQSLASAVQQRKVEATKAKQNQIVTEREFVDLAKQYDAATKAAEKAEQAEKLEQQHRYFSRVLEHRGNLASNAKQEMERMRAEAEAEHQKHLKQEAEDAARRRKLFEESVAEANRAKERREAEHKQQVQDSLEELNMQRRYFDEQNAKKSQFESKLAQERKIIEIRAACVATKIKPTKKQLQQDRIEEDFDRTSSQLLATNIQLNEAIWEATRQKGKDASVERNRIILQRAQSKRDVRSAKIREEEGIIAKDKSDNATYQQILQQMRQQQKEEVRNQLEMQRRIAMKRALDDAAAE